MRSNSRNITDLISLRYKSFFKALQLKNNDYNHFINQSWLKLMACSIAKKCS